MTSFNFFACSQARSPNAVTLEGRASTHGFQGTDLPSLPQQHLCRGHLLSLTRGHQPVGHLSPPSALASPLHPRNVTSPMIKTPGDCRSHLPVQIPSPRPGLVSLLCHLPWGLPRGNALFFLCLTTLPLFFLEPTCARCSAPLLVTVIISPLALGSHGQFSGLSSTVACLPGIRACRC